LLKPSSQQYKQWRHFWDDDELLNVTGKTVDSKGVRLQGNKVNNGFIENIQDYGGDAVIH
jgi:hypothetical protein